MNQTSEQYGSTLPFAAWEGAFTPAELDRIEAYGDSLTAAKAKVDGDAPQGKEDDASRISRTAWIARNPETDWFYDRMERIARTLNDRLWKFSITGFSELFQYTIYNGQEQAYFDWHGDQGFVEVPRKLSFSLQLSHGSHYEGCDLQFHAGRLVETMQVDRGVVVEFPSYVLHRASPVTGGKRN